MFKDGWKQVEQNIGTIVLFALLTYYLLALALSQEAFVYYQAI